MCICVYSRLCKNTCINSIKKNNKNIFKILFHLCFAFKDPVHMFISNYLLLYCTTVRHIVSIYIYYIYTLKQNQSHHLKRNFLNVPTLKLLLHVFILKVKFFFFFFQKIYFIAKDFRYIRNKKDCKFLEALYASLSSLCFICFFFFYLFKCGWNGTTFQRVSKILSKTYSFI